jgi:hypothetical protein
VEVYAPTFVMIFDAMYLNQLSVAACAADRETVEILWLDCNFNDRWYYIACCYHPS